ncbi:hypothetical protein RHMOL_Rhmol11G0004300 [Rhododendron molle]|uniref:Uncharacterized protein n=1 Tax=Rhododendron molle TaxID=49168 RepID=A0ACC0LM73_RHOML|nr:hypothetical protein RHMOL_Rhmol11G0004300 [Rhododendron molle]
MLNLLIGSKTNRSDANQWESCAGLERRLQIYHFNEDTKMWISEESDKNYGNIIEVGVEHAEAGVTSITQEELSIKSRKAKIRIR